jgi:hypothetical protein
MSLLYNDNSVIKTVSIKQNEEKEVRYELDSYIYYLDEHWELEVAQLLNSN